MLITPNARPIPILRLIDSLKNKIPPRTPTTNAPIAYEEMATELVAPNLNV